MLIKHMFNMKNMTNLNNNMYNKIQTANFNDYII